MTNNLELNPVEAYFGVRRFHEYWATFLILGFLLVALGVLSIIAGNITTMGTPLFFGVVLTIAGAMQLIFVLLGRSGQGFSQSLLASAVYAIAGILILTNLDAPPYAFVFLFASLLTVSGAFKIFYSLAVPLVQWGWLLFSGLVSLILGILFWMQLNAPLEFLIGLFIGLDLIFIGWYWITLGITAKNLPLEPEDRPTTRL